MSTSPHSARQNHSAKQNSTKTSTATKTATIRIVLADDHAIMLESLRSLLNDEPDLEVVSEAQDQSSVLRQIETHQPDVLVLEMRLGGASSIDTMRTLGDHAPATKIVMLTMEDGPFFAQRALAAGATGFVAKEMADDELPLAVRAAARGDEYLSPRVAVGLERRHRVLTDNKLSRREIEVLRMITLGHTNAETAHKLHLSPRTVETHRAHIHAKLGLSTKAQLVDYVLRRGLIGA
jgi:two-component system, NarL family, response regulator NreC